MIRGQRKGAAVFAAACGALLTVGALAPAALSAGAGAAGAAQPGRFVLPQQAPELPVGTHQLGAAPADQVLNLDVVLAGQNTAGLEQAVAAVSTPGSPQYRHYLSTAQYAAEYGPDPAEVARVSATLRSEGLTVGAPDPGSTLLPVHGTASVVSAALGTPLVSVQAPGDSARSIVNTASPQIPASLSGVVTGVIGLDGLFQEHAMVRRATPATSESPEATPTTPSTAPPSPSGSGASGGQTPNATGRAATPQACQVAQQTAVDGTFTSTQMSSIFGLDQMFARAAPGSGSPSRSWSSSSTPRATTPRSLPVTG